MIIGDLNDYNLNIKKPLISIVCVTLNAEKTLPNLLRSIIPHKNDDVEFIIIDGNSTDGTLNILEKNRDVVDFWLSEPDAGIYDAMNKSIAYVKGYWIIFLGADDVLCTGFTEAIAFLKDTGTIYYGCVNYYGKLFNKVYDDYYLTKLNICHQSIFYPKAVFSKYKFDDRYNVYADYHLNLRCWKDRNFKFKHINCLIANFADGGYSSFTKDPMFENDRDLLFRKYLKPTSYLRYLNRTLGFRKMLKKIVFDRFRLSSMGQPG